jgi:uncharacterized UPF0146 family protein
MDQDLDALLVDVVAATVAVPHAQYRLEVGADRVCRQEIAHERRDERRAPHASAYIDAEADITLRSPPNLQSDIMQLNRGTIIVRCR